MKVMLRLEMSEEDAQSLLDEWLSNAGVIRFTAEGYESEDVRITYVKEM